eukprot:s1155_g15.t1
MAVNQAGGEGQFLQALHCGESLEVKSQSSGKALYRCEEETLEVGHKGVSSIALAMDGFADNAVWSALYETMDFQSLVSPDSSASAMGSMQGCGMGTGMGMGAGMGMGMGMQGGCPMQMNGGFEMPATSAGGPGGCMQSGMIGGGAACGQLHGFSMVPQPKWLKSCLLCCGRSLTRLAL